MVYEFRPSPDFERQAKKLAKHYPSFKKDLLQLLYIYDKAEIANISDAFLQQIIKDLGV